MITRWDWAVTAGALGLALAGFLALGLLALVKFSALSALPQKPLEQNQPN